MPKALHFKRKKLPFIPCHTDGGDTKIARVINASKLDESLIQGTGIFVLAILAGNGRAALVQQTRQDDISAQPHARAAGRLFSQIWSIVLSHN